MKKLSLLALAALTLTGCWTTRIWTVAPAEETTVVIAERPKTTYTTTVTTPNPRTTTVTTFTATSYNTDWCFYLDLIGVCRFFLCMIGMLAAIVVNGIMGDVFSIFIQFLSCTSISRRNFAICSGVRCFF